MKTRSMIVATALLATGSAAFSTEVQVSREGQIMVSAANTLTPNTQTQEATYPEDAPEPIFWLDCANTNGWEIDAATMKVNLAKSRTGSRYLTSDFANGCPWKNWGASYPANAPVLATNIQALCGGSAIDFGTEGSRKGLLFNLWKPEGADEACLASNVLHDIRCVIAVYDSTNGGGYLMAGGSHVKDATAGFIASTGNLWERGEIVDSTSGLKKPYSSSILHSKGYAGPFVDAEVRQWDMTSTASAVGFAGGWETLSLSSSSTYALNAYGLGFGAMSSTSSYRLQSGGMKIAEMLVFDKSPTAAMREKILIYLERKWFHRTRSGWNGLAEVGKMDARTSAFVDTGLRVTCDVPEGSRIEFGQVLGGRRRNSAATDPMPALIKRGEGSVSVGEIARYNGTVELEAGELSFGCRATPSADELEQPFFHFDAADRDSLTVETVEGKKYVTQWAGDESSRFNGKQVSLMPPAGVDRPFIREDALGEGLDIVDCGVMKGGGACLALATDGTAFSAPGIVTIIAVVGAQDGGGNLGTGIFCRATTNTVDYLNPILPYVGASATTAKSVFLDGRRYVAQYGYSTPGYHVLAVQVDTGGDLRALGSGLRSPKVALSGSSNGGIRFGEVFIYNRPLSERAILDVSAYLHDKWFGRPQTGYQTDAANRAAEIQNVAVNGAASIEVADGSVAVGKVTFVGTLTKTGTGELVVRGGTGSAGGLVVAEGSVVFEEPSDPASACDIAPGASLHLDASATNLMDFVESDGKKTVSAWYSEDRQDFAWQNISARRPWLNLDEEALLNGMPVVDFGEYGSNGKMMNFDKPLESVRSVFMVWRPSINGGSLLASSGYSMCITNGANDSTSIDDFVRGDLSSGKCPLFRTQAAKSVTDGSIYTNGVKVAYTIVPVADYQLVEVHTLGGVHASAFACSLWPKGGSYLNKLGGQRIAEVMIYERVLSTRERTATRNYLMKKWFDREPKDLPAKTPTTIAVPSVKVDGSAVAEVRSGVLKPGSFTGAVTVGEKGVLDCGGEAMTLAAIAGCGTFTNGTVVADRIVHDFSVTGCPTVVDGAFSIPEGFEIELKNLDAAGTTAEELDGKSFELLKAGTFAGEANLEHVAFVGDPIPAKANAKVVVRNGALVLKFSRPRGLLLMIR